mmetsp:Transcript_608/g.1102  ORF Transcript_608/g.1102 Transcript_608/m.1102 type:complete len:371 (+) Transcript_608:163-1275(+)
MNLYKILPIILLSIIFISSDAFSPTTVVSSSQSSHHCAYPLLIENKNGINHVGSHKQHDPFVLQSTQTSSSDSNAVQADFDDANNSAMTVPLTFNDMIKQASQAIADAKSQGTNRQIVRVLLPRDPNSGNLGQYFEDSVEIEGGGRSTQNLLLAPPDESWQGGIMQLYRAALPTCKEILRRASGDVGGVPPKLVEDRSVDESGVDGVGLLMTQSNDPKDDISCFVQPLQETVDAIERISSQAGQRLCILMNPQWRNVDDALDSASKGGGFFGSFANFLGGKGSSLKRLEDAGYREVYVIEGYVCKGGNVRLMKRFDSNWIAFAQNDSETDYIRLGEKKTRPSYQDVERMLDDKGISLKYARDIGLAPKLE